MNEDITSFDDLVPVSLSVWQWAEVCSSLRERLRSGRGMPHVNRRDAMAALLEIDRVMLGADELAPPDDVL